MSTEFVSNIVLPKAEDVTFDIKAYLEMNRDNIENVDEVYEHLNSYYEDMLKVLDIQIKALFSMDSELLEKGHQQISVLLVMHCIFL